MSTASPSQSSSRSFVVDPAPVDGPLSEADIKLYQTQGYLIVEGLFEREEVELLLKIAKADRLVERSHAPLDKSGAQSRLHITGDLHDDMMSAMARSRRVTDRMDQLLGGECYHFHHKMMLKEPKVGGAWEWHQDYGYWYRNEKFLFPHMASCYIAVDEAYKGNGCLQVLKGSQQCGRIEHGVVGTQTGADAERVSQLEEELELVYCEMKPGTALFFHSNLLHRSDRNTSDDPRWSLICCYSRADNTPLNPDKEGARYEKLKKLDDAEVMAWGERQWESLASRV